MVENMRIQVPYVNTVDNLADFFTKPLPYAHDRPMVAMGHENQRKISILRCKTSKSLKKSRAARAKDDLLDHQYRDFAK